MFFDLFIAATLHLLGHCFFGHFEVKTSVVRKLMKVVLNLGVTSAIVWFFGSPWGAVATLVLMSIGTTIHLWWCLKHGIHALTAEPLEKYYSLRGWSLPGTHA